MEERTEYRLYPSFDCNSNPSMKLQYKVILKEDGEWEEKWVDVPIYDKKATTWKNLGWVLMHEDMRTENELVHYTSVGPRDINRFQYVEFPLDVAKENAYDFIDNFRSITKYLLSVIDQYLEDQVELLLADENLSDEQKEQKAKRLADKNAHRITYL